MEHLFKIAIIFAVTVSTCYTNEFLKPKLTTNSVFFFKYLQQYVYGLSRNYLEIYWTTEVIRNPHYTLLVEFLCLVCNKPVATNHKSFCCDSFDK